jgi:hypothetical protein
LLPPRVPDALVAGQKEKKQARLTYQGAESHKDNLEAFGLDGGVLPNSGAGSVFVALYILCDGWLVCSGCILPLGWFQWRAVAPAPEALLSVPWALPPAQAEVARHVGGRATV